MPPDRKVTNWFLLYDTGIGYYAMKRIKGQEDYFLAGRRFGKLVQIFASFGTGTTADNPVTTARTVFTSGLSGIWSVLNWLFLTPFYWFFAVWIRRMRIVTIADFFEETFFDFFTAFFIYLTHFL